ncbi:MAG: Crp/Fnr family transcriptional regulator [Bacteroidia bacterium]
MDLVSKINTLSKLTEPAKEWIENHKEEMVFKKNEIILNLQQTCHYLYYIKSGMACGLYLHNGEEICSWIASEGEFATSYYSFISRKNSYEMISCIEDCLVDAISYKKLHEMYEKFPETERAGRLLLEDYYARLEERLISLQYHTTKERYEDLCMKRPHLINRAPLGKIASYLGMKQETLSRIRSGK